MNNFNIGPLYFQASTLTLVLIGLALIATVAISIVAIRRSTRPKQTTALEVLRFLCVLFVGLMLLGPEWRDIEESDLQPEIAIVWDQSLSMTTEDAPRPDSLAGSEKVITRTELVDRLIKTEFWKPWEEKDKNRVTKTSFGAPPTDADDIQKTMYGSDLNKALTDVLENGQNLRATIFITDGDKTGDGKAPSEAAQQFRLKQIPIYTLATGSDKKIPDLELLSANAPTYGIIGEKVQIPFTIESSLNRDVRAIVRLRDENGAEITKEVTLRSNTTHYDSILWDIRNEGAMNFTLSIPVVSGEMIENNNSRSFVMSGKRENIRVLVIDSLPRWEYRFIRNALSRDPGVDVDCLLLHPDLGKGDGPDYIQEFPEKLEDLQKYDVVFLGDVGIGDKQLTKEQALLLKKLVTEQASGIVFLPGYQGNQFTLDLPKEEEDPTHKDLAELFPVILDDTNKDGSSTSVETDMRLTVGEGEKSLLTMLGDNERQNRMIWRNLPGFYWHAPVIRAQSGSTVLAESSGPSNRYGRIPLLVTKTAGSGKVLYMAIDSAWKWRLGVEDKYHYRFWRQVARWMSYQRNMAAGERIRLFFSPERPKPGNTVSLSANAFDEKGAPLDDESLIVELLAPDKTTSRIELGKEPESWGRFSGQFKINQPGEWKARIFSANDPNPLIEAKMTCLAEALEKTGRPARFEVLQEISKISKGRMVTADKIADLVKEINSLPEPQPLVTATKLWAHWLAPTILVTLLALFWIGRKLNGTF